MSRGGEDEIKEKRGKNGRGAIDCRSRGQRVGRVRKGRGGGEGEGK